MKRFVEGVDRAQRTLFPECLDDWIGEESPVRVIDPRRGRIQGQALCPSQLPRD
jgi:hypothetical protein